MADHFDPSVFLNDAEDDEIELVRKLGEPILPEEPALATS